MPSVLSTNTDLTAGELHIFTFAEILTCTVDIHNEQVDESRHNLAYSECWELCNTRNMYSPYNWYSTYIRSERHQNHPFTDPFFGSDSEEYYDMHYSWLSQCSCSFHGVLF